MFDLIARISNFFKKTLKPSDIKLRRKGFYPINDDLKTKNNYMHQHFTRPDGSTIDAIYLSVSDIRLREEIISRHYCKQINRFFYGDRSNFYIVGRDNPWDFEIIINDEKHFYLEVVSISDNQEWFTIQKREETLKAIKAQEYIPFHKLRKIEKSFPGSISKEIISNQNLNQQPETLIKNPLFNIGPSIFNSKLNQGPQCLKSNISNAISSKEKKRHSNKDITTLIIDNRTTLAEPNDVLEALKSIGCKIDKSPFREIWFYTGFFSDNDGENAEFSFIPIKLTGGMKKTYNYITKNGLLQPNEEGTVLIN